MRGDHEARAPAATSRSPIKVAVELIVITELMPAPLGQNFLRDPAWQRRIAQAVHASATDRIVEIGGGPGELTELLAESGARLLVIELDPALARGLQARFRARENVRILEADVLKVDFAQLFSSSGPLAGDSRARVFGNLPYYITAPILLRLFAAAHLISDATVMVQLEFAERMIATAGGSEFGLLSATSQLFATVHKLFDIPPGAFRPVPKIWSTLLRLDFAPRAAELGVDANAFVEFLKLAFAQKRKRLANNLKKAHPAAAIESALTAETVAPNARAEQLPLETLAAIFRRLHAGG